MLKLYMLKENAGNVDLYLAIMKKDESINVIGAVIPGFHANYYKELIISANYDSLKNFWQWVKIDLEIGENIKMSEDFPFPLDSVKIITLEEIGRVEF